MKKMISRQLLGALAGLGVQPRRTAASRITEALAWFGLGTAVGATVVLASRSERVKSFYGRVAGTLPKRSPSVMGKDKAPMPGRAEGADGSRPLHA